MAGVYADDGSYNVTLTAGSSREVTVDNSSGVYAADGSYRVTIVADETGGGGPVDGSAIFISDFPLVVVVPSTIDTHTSPGNVLTQLPAGYAIVSGDSDIEAPEITGTYTTGYSFTVVDGVITAITAV